MLRQIGDKDQKIQNLEALLQKSKENISLLEKEREDLYAKIQAGEGETAVLNQLQEKNHMLQEQVRNASNSNTQKSSLSCDVLYNSSVLGSRLCLQLHPSLLCCFLQYCILNTS